MSHWNLRLALVAISLMGVAVGASVAMAGNTELMLTGPNSNVAQKAKIVGNTLMLLGQNGKWSTAPDGAYRAIDGGSKEIVIQRGIIVVNGIVGPNIAPAQRGGGRGTKPSEHGLSMDPDPAPVPQKKNVPPPKEGSAGDALRRGMEQTR
ncbi:MAG: hypothetical protein HYY11_03475 [Candidatus Methylomirabilis oxyfera]|nr:hypothetical protein [Candidatus Methylomirabilis oxyfera]